MGGNCPRGSCPGENYSGVIVLTANVRGIIVLGGISWGASVRGAVVHKGVIQG